MFDITTHDPNPILQLPTGPLEGIIDGKREVRIAPVGVRRAAYIHLDTVGQSKTDAYLILTACLMMSTGIPDRDAAGGDPPIARLEIRNVAVDGLTYFRCAWEAFKFNLNRRLHDTLHRGTIFEHSQRLRN